MQNIILTAVLVILAALAGCSSPTQTPRPPTPSPEATPTQPPSPTERPTTATVPAATPAAAPTTIPTPVPAATATPEPPSTPAPKGERQAGVLSPLSLHSTEDVNSELSEAELSCLKEGSPGLHLSWAFILPGYGDPQERVEIIGCLEDETVARIFFADIAEGVATLSLESSACIRAAFNEIDPRSMMLAKVEGFPEDTLNSATTLHFVTMACLNDAEWETAAEWLQEESELRGWMQCMMEKLGGPGEMATAMTVGDEEHQKALAEAAAAYAEEMGPEPSETPAAPTATPESVSTPEPSGIAPLDPDNSAELLSRLSQQERDCVTDVELLTGFLANYPDADYEDMAQQMECLGDETLLQLELARLAWYIQDLGGTLRADTASCIQDGLKGISLGILFHEAHTAEPRFVREMYTALWDLTLFYCLSEEEAALAAPDSGITEEEYDGMICIVDAFGGLEGMNKFYKNTGAEEFTETLMTNLYGCPGR